MKSTKNLFFAFILFIPMLAGAQNQLLANDPQFWTLVSKEAKVEQVATGFIFTEGPVWHKKENYLLFSDIPANTIYKLTPDGKATVFKNPSQNSNGLTFDPQGNLVICEQATKRIAKLVKDGKVIALADQFDGKTFNSPNDIVFKKDGSFYFTDPPYGHMQFNADKRRELAFTGVYYSKNGIVTLVDSVLPRANGACLSPDEKTLYIAQSEFGWLWKAYDLDQDGRVLKSRIFYEGKDIIGNPDGIKVDHKGNVYCTANNGVVIFTKEGKLLGTIKTPENPANLCWGDKDLKTLYITAKTSIYKVMVLTTGWLGY